MNCGCIARECDVFEGLLFLRGNQNKEVRAAHERLQSDLFSRTSEAEHDTSSATG